MASVRPLRELLADLVGDAGAHSGGPEAYLAEHGHADLPPELMAEAVVSFADTAPPEVAEHLAPFVTAHTTGDEDPADWFDLLASAELPDEPDDPDVLDGDPEPWSVDDFGSDPGPGLDFGAGAVDGLDHVDALDDEAPTDWPADVDHTTPDTTEPANVDEPESEDVIADLDDDDADEDELD
jgi:hypothetical protein